MIINSLSPAALSFKGRVKIDNDKINQNISNCPPSTRTSIRGNVDTLCERYKTQTPDDKIAEIDFNYRQTDEAFGWYGIGTVSIKGEHQILTKDFRLCERTTGQEVWEDGFEEITKKALDLSFDVDDEEINREIDEAYKMYCHLSNLNKPTLDKETRKK